MSKKDTSDSINYATDKNNWEKGIAALKEDGYYQIQRPHRRLPVIMAIWENVLKKSDCLILWFSKRIKGRRTVVRAVAGAHFVTQRIGDEKRYQTLNYVIKKFSDYEIEEYEKDY